MELVSEKIKYNSHSENSGTHNDVFSDVKGRTTSSAKQGRQRDILSQARWWSDILYQTGFMSAGRLWNRKAEQAHYWNQEVGWHFQEKTGRAKNSLPSNLNYIVKTDLLIFIESSLAGHQANLYRKLGTGRGASPLGSPVLETGVWCQEPPCWPPPGALHQRPPCQSKPRAIDTYSIIKTSTPRVLCRVPLNASPWSYSTCQRMPCWPQSGKDLKSDRLSGYSSTRWPLSLSGQWGGWKVADLAAIVQ